MLTPLRAAEFPGLVGQIGTVVEGKKVRAWWGKCYLVKFSPGGKPLWAFFRDTDLVRVPNVVEAVREL